jgi:hypothetical protein
VEYYQLRALFEPYQIRTEMVPGQIDFEKDGIPRAFDAHLDVPTHLHIRGDDRNPDKTHVMEPAIPAFLSFDEGKLAIAPVALPAEATYPGLREFVVSTHHQAAQQQIESARAAVDAAKKKLAESEQLAAKAETPAKDETKPDSEKSADSLVRDDFSAAKPEVWEQLTGKWSYEQGRLIQSQAGATCAALRLKQLPPADFEARLKYIPTGGEMCKSVGISYDVTAEGNEILAYVSAVASGPRSQIAFKQGGNYVYPPTATQARKVDLDQVHEIVLRVRGTLLNMSVDGEHSIAFQLPADLARQKGSLELITYDATVEFVAFELNQLPAELKLAAAEAPKAPSASASAILPVDQAQLAVKVAEKVLLGAEAQLDSIDTRAAAERARNSDPQSPATKDLAIAAAKSERLVAATRADEEVSRAELALLQVADLKKAEAEMKVAAAKTALETAQKTIDMPSETYTPLPGAQKTQEDYQNRNAGAPYPTTSTGRRSAFAKWLTDPRHPLPARVAVNHIWMRHIGKPLVPTVFDFGRKGTPPTHPELLDWLATELVEHNWSMKHIHRLIVTSQAYRLSSSSAGATEATLAVDPDNRFYWRMNPVRMEAQIVRDSLLSLAGELDLTLEGPSIPINDDASRRRSLYFVHSHNEQQKFLSTFDDANVLDCYRRAESIVPQQALAMENSPLATAMAGKIAERIAAANPNATDADFIRAAFMTILSVEPTAEEQATMAEVLRRLTEVARSKGRPNPEGLARTNLVQSLLNHNDFITIR